MMSKQRQVNCFDVVIAGGGLAGASAAIALAKMTKPDGDKLSIAIVEANPVAHNHRANSASFDARVLALAYGSALYLKELGVWDKLSQHTTAIKQIHVSDLSHYGKARLYANDYNISALGYVVEMQRIGDALLDKLTQFNNITWFAPNGVKAIERQPQHTVLKLTDNTELTAALVLACDGANSVIRELNHIERHHSDYQQSAIIANVLTEKPHQGKAFERFTDTGPLAMLPLSDGRCSLVWTLTPEQADEIATRSDFDFCHALTERFGHWLGRITKVGKRFSYPLTLSVAQHQIGHRMALVGNSSHTIHPIAGQGFNLGIRDVKVLSSLVEQAIINNTDIGSVSVLQAYEAKRQVDQSQVIQFTDSLVHLFSNNYFPLAQGRGMALKVLNYLPLLKSQLANKTMGL